MCANAQRDGRPAGHRWRPLFDAAKFGWRPLLDCRAVTLPRREIRCNLQGCRKLANISQPLVDRSSPYRGRVEEILLFNNFFLPLSICASVATISPDKVVRRCRDGDFVLPVPTCRTFQTCIQNSHYGYTNTMYGSVVAWRLKCGAFVGVYVKTVWTLFICHEDVGLYAVKRL